MCQDCHETRAAFAAMEADALRRADGDPGAQAGAGGTIGWIGRYYPVLGQILIALRDVINRRQGRGTP